MTNVICLGLKQVSICEWSVGVGLLDKKRNKLTDNKLSSFLLPCFPSSDPKPTYKLNTSVILPESCYTKSNQKMCKTSSMHNPN